MGTLPTNIPEQRAHSEQIRECTIELQNISDLILVLAFNFTMFSQNKNRLPRDESVVTKWDQLKQYENEENEVDRNSQNAHHESRQYEQTNSLGVIKTFKQLKTSGAKTFSNIRSQVTDLYR